jgi:hypothetical protein
MIHLENLSRGAGRVFVRGVREGGEIVERDTESREREREREDKEKCGSALN